MTEKCPNCGGDVRYYHDSGEYGDGMSRVVCKRKCEGWKTIRAYDRTCKPIKLIRKKSIRVRFSEKYLEEN